MTPKQNRLIEESDEHWNAIQIVHQGEAFPLLQLSTNGTTIRIDDNGLFGGIASRISLQSRIKKIARLKSELAEGVEGLGLVVFASYEDLPLHSRLRLHSESNSASLEPEIAALLERIFLTLIFPGGSSFTARAIYTTSRLLLLFRTFFPTDTGPLPVPKKVPEEVDNLSIEEGFRILLPFDVEQVQTIRAKFLVLPGSEE